MLYAVAVVTQQGDGTLFVCPIVVTAESTEHAEAKGADSVINSHFEKTGKELLLLHSNAVEVPAVYLEIFATV